MEFKIGIEVGSLLKIKNRFSLIYIIIGYFPKSQKYFQ